MKASSFFTYNRAIARWLAPRLARTPLTPNHITTLSLAAGLLAGVSMAGGTRPAMLGGAFFLHLSFILDDCDGEVARIKSMRSVLGMWYDYLADVGVEFALWWGLAFGALRQGYGGFVQTIAALACAGSVLNFWRVAAHRRSGRGGPASYLLGPLSDDGDPSLLVWALAALADPAVFLYLGCGYIFLIWSSSLFQRTT